MVFHNILIFALVLSYLIGSIPFGVIFTKLFTNQKLQEHGSGNIGATNTLRTAGKIPGLLTLIFDVLKGYLPIHFFSSFAHCDIFAYVLLCGHMFPIWLKFRGGKGVATMLGILLGVNLILGSLCFIAWIGFFLITRTASIASLLSVFSTVATVWFWQINIPLSLNALFGLSALILIKHYDNIKRILRSEEPSFSSQKK